MSDRDSPPFLGRSQLLFATLLIAIVVVGFAAVLRAIGRAGEPSEVGRVDALAGSNDPCVHCHRNATPGIVEQFGVSTMAAANVKCGDCHIVKSDVPGAVEHEGTWVLPSPTTTMCRRCHEAETLQFLHSRHGIPAYVAYAGAEGLTEEQLAQYRAIPEGQFDPHKLRNALFALEGPDVTRFACEACHGVGRPAADGSVGQCQKCHLRHEFSLEQARRPETCNNCHIGPDHPQWEIYSESAHGIAYSTGGDRWNWQARPGTLGPRDFPAPTCAICHFAGFGGASTTHDAGERLSWFLAAEVSGRRPGWEDNLVRMQSVCAECHNQDFVNAFYQAADRGVAAINAQVHEADSIMQPLKDRGLLTSAPFDEPIDFVYFENWHHWGRTAKFGMWMQGPDYTQWHGAYEMLKARSELREMAGEKLRGSGGGRPGPVPPPGR